MAYNKREMDIRMLHDLQFECRNFQDFVELILSSQPETLPDFVFTELCTSVVKSYKNVDWRFNAFKGQWRPFFLETGDRLPNYPQRLLDVNKSRTCATLSDQWRQPTLPSTVGTVPPSFLETGDRLPNYPEAVLDVNKSRTCATLSDQGRQSTLTSILGVMPPRSTLPETGDGLPDDQMQAFLPVKGGKRAAKSSHKGIGGKKSKTAQERKMEDQKSQRPRNKGKVKGKVNVPLLSMSGSSKPGGTVGTQQAIEIKQITIPNELCEPSKLEGTIAIPPDIGTEKEEGTCQIIMGQWELLQPRVLSSMWTPVSQCLKAKENNRLVITRSGFKIPKSSFYTLTIGGEIDRNGEGAVYLFVVEPTMRIRKKVLFGLNLPTQEGGPSASHSHRCFLDANEYIDIWGKFWRGCPYLVGLSFGIVQDEA